MKKGIIQIFFSNVIFMLFGALTNFFLPKYLSINSYAEYKTYILYLSYANLLALGYTEGMFLKYGGENFEEAKRLGFSKNRCTMVAFQLIVGVIIATIGVVVGSKLAFLFAIGAFTTNMCNYYKNFSTAIGDFGNYSILTSMEKIMVFAFNMALLFWVKLDNAYGYILVLIVVTVIEVTYYLFFLRRRGLSLIKIEFSIEELKSCLKLGIVLMIGNLMSNVFTGIDQWFVKLLMSNTDFAIYSFSVSMEKMVALFITPIATVMYNFLCKNEDSSKFKKIQDVVLIWAMALLTISFPMKWVVKIYLPAYEDAINIAAILFAGQAVGCLINCIYINMYKAKKRQREFLIQMFEMSVIAVVLDTILCYAFGSMVSIAIATLVTKVIWLIVCQLEMKEYRYDIKSNVILCLTILVNIGLCILCNEYVGLAVYIGFFVVVLYIFFRPTIRMVRREIVHKHGGLNNNYE